ncbi:AfsR/SARP family transcriptional regulator [Streptomyces bugieae]|uniref:Tetratricopeptide repeat protein n=1 Tax=Streptomyces bugieae TaxID=3098223 RepID=A0ABU7NTH0_9ACTN|nr:tetratricopeptide repeat protein [Streptomyces sp. DSM 41528]
MHAILGEWTTEPAGGALVECQFRLSGTVEVRAAGQRNDLGSTKTRLTLAALAWDASRTVSVDTLIARVWDDNPPAKAKKALYAHVSRIRRALQPAGDDAPEITSRANAYVLEADPDCVDLRRYLSLVARASSVRESGSVDEAVVLLDQADSLWRGEPLAGISAYWAEQVRTEVGEKCLAAARLRAEILLGEGRFADAVPGLLRLAGERAGDEALVEQLALALHGSGRTADAAQLLQSTQHRMVRQLGTDASPRLQRIHQEILSGTPARALLPKEAPASRPSRTRRSVTGNLPRDVPWVGRHEEVRRLTAALCEAADCARPVVTVEAISGMGGMGKTSLAVHVAHQLSDRFPDGRLYVDLRAHASDQAPLDTAGALTILLRLLATAPHNLPHNVDELASLWRTTTQDRRMLVILDDAVGAEQIKPLLPASPSAVVIVTSRQRITGLPGVRPMPLEGLPHDEATALFEHRLGPHQLASRADSAEIARLCSYVPLAIELVASRLLSRPSWTNADLLRQLKGSGGGHLAEIHDGERWLMHIFALSYRALAPLQRLVFRRVGWHFGTEFGPPAAAALAGVSVEVAERTLEELNARHLVIEPSPHRFRMHDLLREFARTLADEGLPNDIGSDSASEARHALRRLVVHYLRVADKADRLAYPFRSRLALNLADTGVADHDVRGLPVLRDSDEAHQWFVTEGGNLLAALEYTRARASVGSLALMVHVLAGFLDVEGYLATGGPLLRSAVTHWQTVGDDSARARALLDLSTVCAHGGHYEEARTTASEALRIARTLADSELESESIHQLTIPLWHTGRYATALELQKHSLSLRLRTGDALQVARSYNLLGITYLHLDQNDDSLECFLRALSGFSRVGDQVGRYRTLNNVAELQQKRGNLVEAEQAYREAMEISKRIGSRGDHATLEMNLASVLTASGKAEEALLLYEKALPALRSIADVRGEVIARNGMGRALRAIGRSEEALPHHVAALSSVRRIQAAGEEAVVLHDLGCAEQDTGRFQQAAVHLEASLGISRRIGARAEESRTRRALVRLRQMRGLPTDAGPGPGGQGAQKDQ